MFSLDIKIIILFIDVESIELLRLLQVFLKHKRFDIMNTLIILSKTFNHTNLCINLHCFM